MVDFFFSSLVVTCSWDGVAVSGQWLEEWLMAAKRQLWWILYSWDVLNRAGIRMLALCYILSSMLFLLWVN